MPASEGRLLPGLVYLNSGVLGPTSRTVHDAVVAAAGQFELNPTAQGYWSGDTVSAAATRARDQIAALDAPPARCCSRAAGPTR